MFLYINPLTIIVNYVHAVKERKTLQRIANFVSKKKLQTLKRFQTRATKPKRTKEIVGIITRGTVVICSNYAVPQVQKLKL